jgi:hypothetical protein
LLNYIICKNKNTIFIVAITIISNFDRKLINNLKIKQIKQQPMKKLFTLFAVMLFASFVIGQTIESPRGVLKDVAKVTPSTAKVPTDTIMLADFFTNATAFYNYLAPGYGYIFGPHWDTAGVARAPETAQGYIWDNSTFPNGYGIEEALIWTSMKYKTSVDGANLYVNVYKINGSSSYTIGGTQYTIACPNTLLRKDTILWTDIDTSTAGWTTAHFSPPVYINFDYAVGLDVTDFYAKGDTVSIIGGEGCASTINGLEYTYYKYPLNPPKWVQFSHIWTSGGNPLDAAIAIFPVVDRDYVGIDSRYFMNGMKLSCNPNPVAGDAHIQYAIEKDANVDVEVYSNRGQLLFSYDQGNQKAGQFEIVINADKLANGTYYCSIISNGQRLTKKMIVNK